MSIVDSFLQSNRLVDINNNIVDPHMKNRRQYRQIVYRRHGNPPLPFIDGLGRGEAQQALEKGIYIWSRKGRNNYHSRWLK